MNTYRRNNPPAFTTHTIVEDILFVGVTYALIVLAAYWFVGAIG